APPLRLAVVPLDHLRVPTVDRAPQGSPRARLEIESRDRLLRGLRQLIRDRLECLPPHSHCDARADFIESLEEILQARDVSRDPSSVMKTRAIDTSSPTPPLPHVLAAVRGLRSCARTASLRSHH